MRQKPYFWEKGLFFCIKQTSTVIRVSVESRYECEKLRFFCGHITSGSLISIYTFTFFLLGYLQITAIKRLSSL